MLSVLIGAGLVALCVAALSTAGIVVKCKPCASKKTAKLNDAVAKADQEPSSFVRQGQDQEMIAESKNRPDEGKSNEEDSEKSKEKVDEKSKNEDKVPDLPQQVELQESKRSSKKSKRDKSKKRSKSESGDDEPRQKSEKKSKKSKRKRDRGERQKDKEREEVKRDAVVLRTIDWLMWLIDYSDDIWLWFHVCPRHLNEQSIG